jgi:hypothetical protein
MTATVNLQNRSSSPEISVHTLSATQLHSQHTFKYMQNKNPTHGQPAHPQTVVGLHPKVKHPQNLACKYVMIINPEMLEPIAHSVTGQ